MARTKTVADAPVAAPRVTTCSHKVKGDDYNIGKCGERTIGGRCPNKSKHLNPFATGFCSIGAHEGAKIKDARGVHMMTCQFWQTCPCSCHKTYDSMFRVSEMPRIVIDNSAYEHPKNTFWMPTAEERAAMHAAAEASTTVEAVIIESPDPEHIPASLVKEYAPTATGRAARGELEANVRRFCDEWLVEKYGDLCTPAWLSERIGRSRGETGPSVGAIDAVFKRWEALGFAVIERKPTRFSRYTENGIRLGLEALKIKAKDQQRNQAAASARTLRPSK